MSDELASLHAQISTIRNKIRELVGRPRPESSLPLGAPDPDVEELQALREEMEDLLDILSPDEARRFGVPVEGSGGFGPEGLAIVIGHTAAQPGFSGLVPPFPQAPNRASSEYHWNSDLAFRIRDFAKAHSIRCDVFTRDGVGVVGSYDKVKQWGPKATVELHFNDAGDADTRPFTRGTLTLYGAETSKAWAQTLQDAIVRHFDRQGPHENRGIHIPGPGSGYSRARLNVTQIHPSALIEPFFGMHPGDAQTAVQTKQALAETIVRAFAKFAGIALGDAPSGGTLPPRPDHRPTGPQATIPDVPLFNGLRAAYESISLTVPGLAPDNVKRLKNITLAQWALESGWGEKSEVAVQHLNFAGMKALSEFEHILSGAPAERVWAHANDGWNYHLRFGSFDAFIRGYFLFLQRSPYNQQRGRFDNWKAAATSSPEDFIRYIGPTWANNRPGYAADVISIRDRIEAATGTGPASPPADPISPPPGVTGINLNAVPADAALFRNLLATFDAPHDELKNLKPVLAAQWALESNWGRSKLAEFHFNFSGIEWIKDAAGRGLLGDLAGEVPHPTNPEKGNYCRFLKASDFVKGYGLRLERDPNLSNWRSNVGSAGAFIQFLAQKWRPADPDYAKNVRRNFQTLATSPSIGGQPDVPSGGTGTTSPGGTQLDGFVIRVDRTHAEFRSGADYERTVGRYQVFFNRASIPGLSGSIYEFRGPGDNGPSGVKKRRIRQGVYPLHTHLGSDTLDGVVKYKTWGFTTDQSDGAVSRPSVKLMDTGSRSGILIHPGKGYLWSIGCFNPSTQLEGGASGNISYGDSRKRVIAIIDALKAKLGTAFPADNNRRVPNAWAEIVGEPGAAGGGFETISISPDATEETVRALFEQLAVILAGDQVRQDPASAEVFDLFETAIGGGVSASVVDPTLIDKAIANGVNLEQVRGVAGQTLWGPWTSAWQESFFKLNPDQLAKVQQGLREIAQKLAAAGVPINDTKGLHSPMVDAASIDAVETLEVLRGLGGNVNGFDRSGMTPLHAAAYYGAARATRKLLENGAQVDLKTREVHPPGVALSPDEEALFNTEAESCTPNSSPRECAEQGRRTVVGDVDRTRVYDDVISTIWERE